MYSDVEVNALNSVQNRQHNHLAVESYWQMQCGLGKNTNNPHGRVSSHMSCLRQQASLLPCSSSFWLLFRPSGAACTIRRAANHSMVPLPALFPLASRASVMTFHWGKIELNGHLRLGATLQFRGKFPLTPATDFHHHLFYVILFVITLVILGDSNLNRSGNVRVNMHLFSGTAYLAYSVSQRKCSRKTCAQSL